MKKFLLLIFLLTISINLYSIKFTIDNSDDSKKVIIQANFELGVAMDGVNDLFGTTEYQSAYLKPSLSINDFSIGLNFKLRFKLFVENPFFYGLDWFVKDDVIKTTFLYFDKVEFIRYGDPSFPFYFTTGKIPRLTFGSDLVINDLHNYSFLPVARENGLYFKFNGENFEKYKLNNIPFNFTFFMTDVFDPDLFGADFSFDLFKLVKANKKFNLIFELIGIVDFNTTENNRLSTLDQNLIDPGNFRNMNSSGYTTGLMVYSLPVNFIWTQKYFRLNVFNETGMLIDPENVINKKSRVGFGDNLGLEMRLIYLENSGFLLGIKNSIIFQSHDYLINYFSSNYEIVRQKQYLNLSDKFNLYIMTGLAFYGFEDNLHFDFNITIPLNTNIFSAKLSSKLVLEKLLLNTTEKIPNLYIGVFYETSITDFNLTNSNGKGGNNGSYFIESITRDFRFSTEIGFKHYGTKISLFLGIQRPQSLQLFYVNDEINLEKYFYDLQKFVSLEVAFVL